MLPSRRMHGTWILFFRHPSIAPASCARVCVCVLMVLVWMIPLLPCLTVLIVCWMYSPSLQQYGCHDFILWHLSPVVGRADVRVHVCARACACICVLLCVWLRFARRSCVSVLLVFCKFYGGSGARFLFLPPSARHTRFWCLKTPACTVRR